MLHALGKVPYFDIHGRMTTVDQEKSIYTALKAQFSNACIFFDMLHVKKNLAGPMGKEKYTRLFYTRNHFALHLLSCAICGHQIMVRSNMPISRDLRHMSYTKVGQTFSTFRFQSEARRRRIVHFCITTYVLLNHRKFYIAMEVRRVQYF